MDLAVVVPVYNVEDYVEKCVKSLLNQTVEGFQIILVDDGSTDNSGNICDELSKNNDVITVYHKENGGLSDARNYGVKKTRKKYIIFVDSDDTVREDYIEKLYYAITQGKVKIAVANFMPVDEYFTHEYRKTENNYTLIKSKEMLKDSLLGNKGSLSAWSKVFKRELLEKYPFPYGKLYEDMEVVYHMMLEAETIAYIDEALYFYLRRDNSIVRSKVTERHMYGLYSCIRILEDVKANGYGLEDYALCRIVGQACGYLPNLVHCNDKKMFESIAKLVKPYVKKVILNSKASLKLKIRGLTYILPSKVALRYAYVLFEGKKKIVSLKQR